MIRNMHRTTASPPPINLITTWALYLYQIYRRKEYLEYDTYTKLILRNFTLLVFFYVSVIIFTGRQKKKDKYKRMKTETHKKTGKVSPYPGGKMTFCYIIYIKLATSI